MESSKEAQLSTTDNERTTRHTWVKMKKSITKMAVEALQSARAKF
jgi:hypothetical protein